MVVFFFLIPHRLHVLSDSRGKEREKKLSFICECKNEKLDVGWGVPARLLWNLSLCINVEDFLGGGNHSVEMRHESHLDGRGLRYYIWLTNSDLSTQSRSSGNTKPCEWCQAWTAVNSTLFATHIATLANSKTGNREKANDKMLFDYTSNMSRI